LDTASQWVVAKDVSAGRDKNADGGTHVVRISLRYHCGTQSGGRELTAALTVPIHISRALGLR